MSSVTNLWRQLVQRRLWPVAIAMVTALVAVPLTLAKQPEPTPPAPPVPSVAKSELAETPIVAQAAPTDRARRRRVLGKAKNPFAVAKPTPTPVPATQQPSTDGSPQGGSSTPSSSTPVNSTPVGSTPVPTTPVPKPKKYNLYDLTVRFGDSSSDTLPRMTLKRLQPLPSAETPVFIYMGILKDGKTAVFLPDDGVEATGDGECKPATSVCETVQLRAGETEFFDVKDETGNVTAQYELDLVKIHKGATTSARKARASYAGSKAGRRLLKSHVAAAGPTGYRWTGSTGTLQARPVQPLGTVFARGALRLP